MKRDRYRPLHRMVNKTAILGDNCAANSIIVSKRVSHLLCAWSSHSAVFRNSLWTMAGFRVTSNRFLSLIVRIGTTFARRLVPRVVPIQPDRSIHPGPFRSPRRSSALPSDVERLRRPYWRTRRFRLARASKRHARFFGIVDTRLRDLLSPMTVLFRRLSCAPLNVSSLSFSLSLVRTFHRAANAQTTVVILAACARRGINRALFKYSARFPNRFFKSLLLDEKRLERLRSSF